MDKEKLMQLMRKHMIVDCELVDVIRFVRDLLELKADELKKKEPYATVGIKHLMIAAHEVDYLESDIDEIMEDDEDESED